MSNVDWYILLLSMLPVTELRATIPFAIAMGMCPWRAWGLAVVGNLLPVIPILFLLQPLEKMLSRFLRVGWYFQGFLQRTRLKGGKVTKYGLWGLFFFVLIPLPGTGVWTGAVLTWVFGLPYFPAVIAIGMGVFGAGILVTLASLGLLQGVYLYGGEFLFGVLIFMMFLWWWIKKKG